MKRIGFLSFGHWSDSPYSQVRTASDALLQSIDLAVAVEALGGDGAFYRVHHFARQLASPFPLLAAVGARTTKIEIGTAFPGHEVQEIDVVGRHLAAGVPRTFTMNSNEILDALQEPLAGIVSAVKKALERTPPELGSDVAERGIVLTGGGALLRDIDKLISEETGLPVLIADDPLTCVARGGGIMLDTLDQHGELLSVE